LKFCLKLFEWFNAMMAVHDLTSFGFGR